MRLQAEFTFNYSSLFFRLDFSLSNSAKQTTSGNTHQQTFRLKGEGYFSLNSVLESELRSFFFQAELNPSPVVGGVFLHIIATREQITATIIPNLNIIVLKWMPNVVYSNISQSETDTSSRLHRQLIVPYQERGKPDENYTITEDSWVQIRVIREFKKVRRSLTLIYINLNLFRVKIFAREFQFIFPLGYAAEQLRDLIFDPTIQIYFCVCYFMLVLFHQHNFAAG